MKYIKGSERKNQTITEMSDDGGNDDGIHDDQNKADWRLLFISCILLMCEVVKILINTFQCHCLPAAGGCILVGFFFGLASNAIVPEFDVDKHLNFDDGLFLCMLLPIIVFEAALSVNKTVFRKRRLSILMFAVTGTILSTWLTGFLVHYLSLWFSATEIPLLDSFIFGALISSIDPISILSVLKNLNLCETDTIFVLVFGESLLNDGISITIFHSLARRCDISEWDWDFVWEILSDFLLAAFGSIFVAILCGCLSLLYFHTCRNLIHPPMEVASFFIWAFVPYYICNVLEWSGIIALVTMGIILDFYVSGTKVEEDNFFGDNRENDSIFSFEGSPATVPGIFSREDLSVGSETDSLPTYATQNLVFRDFKYRMSSDAYNHIRFVAMTMATLSENAIFAFLGLFLFSKTNEWDISLVWISIFSCVMGRVFMVKLVSAGVQILHKFSRGLKNGSQIGKIPPSETALALRDGKVQLVLVLAGLRGAVSMALVESLNVYDEIQGCGTMYKPELKAMTSSAIIFTMFVFGGSAHYILTKIGVGKSEVVDFELTEFPEHDSGYSSPSLRYSSVA